VTPAELAERWLATVQAQLAAARGVDGEGLGAANLARAEVQDEVLAALRSGPGEARRALAQVAPRIRELDQRIHACGRAVLAGLDRLVPAATPSTYTRHARLRDAR